MVNAETTIARGVAAQDDAAKAIFREQFAWVFRTLRRLGVPDRDLEDFTHEVFVTFYRRIDAYDPSRPIRPWLFGIAYRIVSNHSGLQRTAREELGERDAADDAPLPDAQLDLERRRRLVLDALDRLTPERKAVLIMHDLDGTTMSEIADAIGIPLNTAYSRLRLAREDFKKAVRVTRGVQR